MLKIALIGIGNAGNQIANIAYKQIPSFCINTSEKDLNTLSPAAAALCNSVIPCAIVVNGFVNSLVYIINDTIVSKPIFPFIVSIAPTTHMATYPKLPINDIIGDMSPDKN